MVQNATQELNNNENPRAIKWSPIGNLPHNRNLPAVTGAHAGTGDVSNYCTWTQAEKISKVIIHVLADDADGPLAPTANFALQHYAKVVADAASDAEAAASLQAAGTTSTDVDYIPVLVGESRELDFDVSSGVYLSRLDFEHTLGDAVATRIIVEAYQ